MTPATAWVVPAGACLLAWLLTGLLRQYALARHMVDIPNARSSHQVATPRGGGAAIVIATTAAAAVWWWFGGPGLLPWGVVAAGLLVAAVGFIDDHRPLTPVIRLAGHTLASVMAVASLGGAAFGIVGACLAIFFVAWLINLTNFMDGIDGIAGAQTVTVCAAGAVLTVVVAPGTSLWLEPAVVAAATVGFLAWNWPPAKIFMGDVGSGYVGFMVAVLTMRAATVAPALGWSWVILSAVFIVDATVTLLVRAVRRERLFQAHRSHAYQHLALVWGGHRSVTVLVVGINVCWLMPLAALVAMQHLSEAMGLLLGYGPLTIGALYLGAGRPRETGR